MYQSNCLNLCEILTYLQKKYSLQEIFNRALNLADIKTCERIYVGSSFCSKYFLQLSDRSLGELFHLCEEQKMKITLVIPVFSEGDLEKGKKKLHHIVERGCNVIDELTVNDYGMLIYVRQTFQLIINTGRLFMKDYRDPRYEEYYHIVWKPEMFTSYFKEILKEYSIHSCEVDMTHECMDFSDVPGDIVIGVHAPYCYQTVGRICECASINKEMSKKFRPNDVCEENCKESIVRYSVTDENMEYLRFGRTVYFKNPDYRVKGLEKYRFIFFPIELS